MHLLVSSRELNEPRACYTAWNKSEKEKWISHINTYIWNLERWYWWTYLQGRNRDADVENGLVDSEGEGEGWMNWESSVESYTLPCVKWIANGRLLYITESSTLFCDNLEEWDGIGGRRELLQGRHMCTYAWVVLLCGRSQYNTVKQLPSN